MMTEIQIEIAWNQTSARCSSSLHNHAYYSKEYSVGKNECKFHLVKENMVK